MSRPTSELSTRQTKRQALIEALYDVEDNGKAEIINGKIIRIGPSGVKPSRAAGKILAALANYEETVGGGQAFGGNVGFLIDLPNRQSFSPDAAWYVGPLPENEMLFVSSAPTFAVEVREESDYGPKAELRIARKISDYLAAGTQVVWDVNLLSDNVVTVHRLNIETDQAVYRRGDSAEAEPAVPGWSIAVDWIMR